MHENMIIAQLNIRSLITKLNDIKHILEQHNYSILCLTETWLSPEIADVILQIPNYTLIRKDRVGRGGGVCMYVSQCLNFKINSTIRPGVEQLWINLNLNRQKFAVGVIYKSPSYSNTQFIGELESELSSMLPEYDEIFCLGDFNIDMMRPDSPDYKRMGTMFESLGLTQTIKSPTRSTLTSATLIDLIITSCDDSIIKDSEVVPVDHISDHDLTYIAMNITNPEGNPVFKSIRDFKNFYEELFYEHLQSIHFEAIFGMDCINDKADFLSSNILQVFNFHAPIKTIRITKKHNPWITDNIKLLMSLRDKARSKWRKSKNSIHYNYYKDLRNYTTLACRNEKKAYLEYKIRTYGINHMWKYLNVLNAKKTKIAIPEQLKNVNDLNNYYIHGISRLPSDRNIFLHYENESKSKYPPFTFKLVTDFEVQAILYGVKTNAIGHDGINIKLLLMCCPFILPFVTHIVNFCLENGVFPDNWKEAVVLPIPKNSSPKEYKDLRPISILATLSKVLERVVDNQLREYLFKFNLLPESQSGFRPLHSCETALLNITDDILRATDQKQATAMVLLDFSKAFDTLNHELLFTILKYFGISGKPLNFFRNYLNKRRQRVRIGTEESNALELTSGVPQGSIIGPLLFILYTSDFYKQIKYCKISSYADDTQLYHSFFPNKLENAIKEINDDLASLIQFSHSHSLNLNAKKTSLVIFGTQNLRSQIQRAHITVDGHFIEPTENAKNLGVIFDSQLRFKQYINSRIRLSYARLKMIYANRYCLSKKAKTILCDSVVLSNFNFADTVYNPCIDADDIRRIQVVQNSCLRLIFGIRRGQHISHKLKELKWLNMSERRLLHSACLFHTILTKKTPPYLYRKITHRTDIHNLNIRHKGTLTPPCHRRELFKRSFSYQITAIYNSIPRNLKTKTNLTFKKEYKKYLLSK